MYVFLSFILHVYSFFKGLATLGQKVVADIHVNIIHSLMICIYYHSILQLVKIIIAIATHVHLRMGPL